MATQVPAKPFGMSNKGHKQGCCQCKRGLSIVMKMALTTSHNLEKWYAAAAVAYRRDQGAEARHEG